MVRVPLRVTWSWMMLAKVKGALRPSRVLLHLFVVAVFALLLAGPLGRSPLELAAVGFVGFTGFRLVVMGISAQLDRDARRYDGAVLVFAADHLSLELPDGFVQRLEWSWIRAVRETPLGFELQTATRGGRFWLFLSRERCEGASGDALRTWFVERALLVPRGQ